MMYHKHAWLLATSLALFANIDRVLGHKEGVRESEGNVIGAQGVIKDKTSGGLDGNGSNLRGHDDRFEVKDDPNSNMMSKDETNELWPDKRRKTKGDKSKKQEKSKSGKKDKDASKACDTNYCEVNSINLGSMKSCLKDNFDHLSTLYFPEDGDGYLEARQTAFGISRYPAAIVYVEDVDEVKAALACAVDNGYKVSARGGNHSFQGLATMDGYVVIDMGRTCKPEEFVIDKDDQGPHILEGSKYIGTMKGQAGCTNAVMLAMGHEHFQEEGGMTLIGSCPSVGITGFVLGGGSGDITPYVGYAIDIVKEFQIVLYDGTVVKASEDENSDLYWASRGGGGGNGIVTHLTYKVIQAPKQKMEEEEGKKFSVFRLNLLLKPESFEKGAARIQEWFYDADPFVTGKFGGDIQWSANIEYPPEDTSTLFTWTIIYLGSWREAIEELQSTGLLDKDLFDILYFPMDRTDDAVLVENYEVLCTQSESCVQFEDTPGATHVSPLQEQEEVPDPSIQAVQFNTYAEAQIFKMCIGALFSGAFDISNTSGDFCEDLNIDNEKCTDGLLRVPKSCIDKDVIDAMLTAAGDPTSFMNSHGPSPELQSIILPGLDYSDALNVYLESISSKGGASMFQRFDDAFFAKLIRERSDLASHIQHGAALHVHPDHTAYPWRNAAMLVEYGTVEDANFYLRSMLEAGYTPQGYYAYLNPPGMKNWRSYFFDDKWHKLTEIRGKYDPKDVFGKPLTIESIGE